ncbi:hypothetical protein QCA50_014549 [Cerrena zonata]|uniref:Cytochrome P450 n=1 Tax=Cerrena zonata TaxID=2478898 RepID=A0AAW0FVP7_9APHY
MLDEPFEFVKRQLEEGTAVPSYVSRLLELEDVDGQHETNIKMTASTMYGGGADTSVSTVYSFFLAMTLNPAIQAKAQEEIDRVIGTDRLPTLNDRDSLPYTDALVKELFRWNPVLPLGFPHSVIQDDIHKGYFIPKGSMIMVNVWHILHDPEVYVDPFSFNPDRHLGEELERDPRDVVFGFGRRVCPGMHLADASVFLTCMLSLAAFDISKVIRGGKTIEPVCEYQTGFISHPKEFECSIKPRSSRTHDLILSETEI